MVASVLQNAHLAEIQDASSVLACRGLSKTHLFTHASLNPSLNYYDVFMGLFYCAFMDLYI